MNTQTNQAVVLAKRPHGMPKASDFAVLDQAMPHIKQGEILLESLYLSVDPYMRGRMDDRPSYLPPFQINQPISGAVVAKVIKSEHPEFQVGDLVSGMMSFSKYLVSDGKEVNKLDPRLPPSAALGVLGIPGITGYFGVIEVGKVRPNETVVISSAAGAVGTTAGQVAKIKGARVIGICGSEQKAHFLMSELGFDVALNYKDPQFANKLKAACPNGVDVYFDNVGGDISRLVNSLLNRYARVVLCGQITAYNDDDPKSQLDDVLSLITRSVTLRGFLVLDFLDRFPEAVMQMAVWIGEGRLKYKETITSGLEKTPEALVSLFRGDNIGKQVVQI